MKKFIIVLVFFLVVSFTSCEPGGYRGNDLSAFTLIQVQCPYTNSYFSNSEIVEQDSFGRILFRFWGGSDLAFESEDGNLYIYAIIQRETDEYVWFYETDCYMMKPSLDDFTEQDLTDLKKRNSWDKTLDLSCASKIKVVSKNDRQIALSYSLDSIDKLCLTICKEYEYYAYLPICNDSNGQTLIFIRTYTRDAEWNTQNYTAYAVILKADGSFSDDSIVKMNDFYDHTACLKILKARNQWTLSQ